MSSAYSRPSSRLSYRWLVVAGLATGVFGGVAAVTYLMLDGMMRGDGPWLAANLFAGVLFPSTALAQEFSRATLAGLSLLLISFGAAGAIIGPLLLPFLHRRRLFRAAAVVFAFFWYYATLRLGWSNWNPPLVVFQPFPGLLLSHLVFGVCMGMFPAAVDELRLESDSSPAV